MIMIAEKTSQARDHARQDRGPGAERPPRVTWSEGVVRLQDPDLFRDPGCESCRNFLRRAFRLDEVHSVELDPGSGSAAIRFGPGADGTRGFLGRLAGALRDALDEQERPGLGPIPAPRNGCATLKISRYGTLLSSWEVVHELAGRVRLRHEALRGDAELAQRIARELATVHGVESCRVRPLTGSLLVGYDPAALSTRQIVQILDSLLQGSALSLAYPGDPAPVPFGLANTSVALAAVGEFALPVLLPASAVLLLASNVKTFRAAWKELCRREPGLPVLYTTIVVATLASGQFLAAALMGWMLKFWRRQHRERLLATRRRLLPGLSQHGRFARLCAGAAEAQALVEVPLERLRPGDQVMVEAGEIIPADGRVLSGQAMVDERRILTADGLAWKRPGEMAFAGALVVEGAVRLEVTHVGSATRAATLAGAVLAATTPAPSPSAVTAHGEAFARRAVVPTLATAGLGLVVGDLTTAAAVLRPDYATGPGLGVSLEWLQDAAACAQEGVLILGPEAFRQLAEVNVLLVDDHPALRRPALQVETVVAFGHDTEESILRYAATAFGALADERSEALREACAHRGLTPFDTVPAYLGPGPSFFHGRRLITVTDTVGDVPSPPPLTVSGSGQVIGRVQFHHNGRPAAAAALAALRDQGTLITRLVSSRPEPEARALAEALGVTLYGAGLSSEAKAEILRSYRARGVKVAYIGDCHREADAARAAHVAIAVSGENDGNVGEEVAPATIVLLRGGLARLPGLHARARSHVLRVRAVHGSALIPNLVCVTGAFFFGFTSLSSVIVTNLGTLGVYAGLAQRVPSSRDPRAARAVIVPQNGTRPRFPLPWAGRSSGV